MKKIVFVFAFLFLFEASRAEGTAPEQNFREIKGNTVIYRLTIDYKTVNFTGRAKKAMAINNSLPAPVLYFKEGQTAIIHVTNKMDVESSVHWHGILLPNFQDGVPYLTTPPILPGKTHTYTFPLQQSGTYWYHSHTGLQEQRGLYGAIIIEPKQQKLNYDHDLAVVLSDWTDENPHEVMRTLKRRSEWYSIKKGTTQSLIQVIVKKSLMAQLRMWGQRMPGMDISDVYYPAFLLNGKREQNYPDFKAGETIRLRVINASASTYFWLTFGGQNPLLVSADGVDVHPVSVQKVLHAIGETYDFLITIPKKQAIQLRATAQDGSGTATAIVGRGKILKAPLVPKPDLIRQMKEMAESHGSGSHSGHGVERAKHKSHRKGSEQHKKGIDKKEMAEHKTDHLNHKEETNFHTIEPEQNKKSHNEIYKKSKTHAHSSRGYEQKTNHKGLNKKEFNKIHVQHQPESFSYHQLRSLKKTVSENPVREIKLDLTGSMWRYVWSMNNRVLSEADKIQIKKGERLRVVLNNKTMMHHPMHLHGHFFRVLNNNGEYSPLKHTVDIPPMEDVTIEFEPDKVGDWFFHCHVLYHMMGGMARVFSHNSQRDSRLKNYPSDRIINDDSYWYKWAEISVMSHQTDWELTASNTRNKILMEGTLSWLDHKYKGHKNFEISASYERFTSEFFRLYTGLEMENVVEGRLGGLKDMDISGQIGFRYLLPYFIGLDMSLDHKARWEVELDYELLLFPRLEVFSDWSLRVDFGFFKNSQKATNWDQEWSAGFEYILSQNFSLVGSYSNHFGWGVGLNLKL